MKPLIKSELIDLIQQERMKNPDMDFGLSTLFGDFDLNDIDKTADYLMDLNEPIWVRSQLNESPKQTANLILSEEIQKMKKTDINNQPISVGDTVQCWTYVERAVKKFRVARIFFNEMERQWMAELTGGGGKNFYFRLSKLEKV